MRGWLPICWVPLAPVLRARPCAVPLIPNEGTKLLHGQAGD